MQISWAGWSTRSCNGSWAGGVLYREYKRLLISVLSAPLCSTFLRELWTFRTLVGSYQSFCVHLSRGGLGTPHWGVNKVTSTPLGGLYDHFCGNSDTWECCMGWFSVTLWFWRLCQRLGRRRVKNSGGGRNEKLVWVRNSGRGTAQPAPECPQKLFCPLQLLNWQHESREDKHQEKSNVGNESLKFTQT